MKHYLVTLQTRDGEFEYFQKILLTYDGDPTDHQAVLEELFSEKLTSCEFSHGYQIENDYRLYLLYHIRELEPEHLPILSQYL